MKNKEKEVITQTLLWLLFTMIGIGLVFLIGEQGNGMKKISIRLETPQLETEKKEMFTKQLLEKVFLQENGQQMRENDQTVIEEPIQMTFWNQEEGVVEVSSLEREVKGTIVRFYGRAEEVAPVIYLVGTGLFSDEKKGCLVNTAMAEKLFGSYEIYGKEIQWNSQKYHIRGVVKDNETGWEKDIPRLYIIGEEEELYKNCEIITREEIDTTSVKEMISQQYPYPFGIWNGYTMNQLIKMIMIGVGWLGLCLSIMLSIQRMKWSFLFLWNGIYFLQQKLIWGTVIPFFSLPQDWIPTKWSDFSWYSDKFQQWNEQLLLWQALCEKGEYQRIQQYCHKVELYLVLMVIGFVWAASKREKKTS